jgi:MinD-like ATPase involved in chromosome partitioning or flagellar assembly
VLISCWSAKGGVGTTVVAAGLALVLAARDPAGAVLADLAGDVPAVLGLAPIESAGLAGWLAAGPSVPADALARLEVPAPGGLAVLPRGPGRLDAGRATVLATLLRRGNRPVVVDCGLVGPPGGGVPAAREVMAAAAVPSLLVTRPCYVALQRFVGVRAQPSGVVVVREPGRALGRLDVEQVVGVPVVAEVEADPAVSRAVDAGLLAAPRLPRSLVRALRHAV